MATATRSTATSSSRSPAKRPPTRKPARPQWPEWVGSWPRLKGRQLPEFESKHDGDEVTQADRCGRFGADIGMRQMPWQWRSLQAMLSVQPPTAEEIEDAEREDREPVSLWTHRDVAIECTRQQGKTLLVVLLILFHMFVLRDARIIYCAQRWATAYDVWKRVCAVINRVPWLKRRLYEKPSKAGNRGSIKLCDPRNPSLITCEVEFGPRSQDFGRGYTEIDLLILDEAYDLDPGEEANLTGAQSAAKNPQTIYISTSPVAAVHPKCHALAGLHRLGHARAPDLYYALYAAPAGMRREDPEAWVLAQPSYGVATNEREIRSKWQKAKTVEQRAIFDADYLGIGEYPPDEDEVGSPIPEAVWTEMRNPDARLAGARTIAVRQSWNKRRWSIVAAQNTADGGRIHVELGPLRSGTHTEIAEYLITKVTEWNPVALVLDRKNGAIVLEPLLIAAGIEPVVMSTGDMALSFNGFYSDALAGLLSHSDQELLNDAVASASLKELPGGDSLWAEDESGVALPLVGASMAHWGLRKFGAKARAVTARARTGAAAAGRERIVHETESDFDAMTSAF